MRGQNLKARKASDRFSGTTPGPYPVALRRTARAASAGPLLVAVRLAQRLTVSHD